MPGLTRLIADLALAKGDGRFAACMKALARVDLLVLDDWGLELLDGHARHHLLEILEDRYGRRATMLASNPTPSLRHIEISMPFGRHSAASGLAGEFLQVKRWAS